MKPSLAFFCGFLAAVVPLRAQQGPVGEGPEILTYPTGEKLIHWHGQPGRTYFMQVSSQAEPLARWTWAPYIEIGDGETISHEIEGDTAKAFFRLVHTDLPLPPGVTLEDWDIDGDGRSNHEEITGYYPSHPLLADTDGDGLDDGNEIDLHYSDPSSVDTDGDGLNDYDEVIVHGTYPWYGDSDWDGVNDFDEITVHFSDPLNPDTDLDGMPDGWEALHGLDLLTDDTLLDPDGDGIANAIELTLRLHPTYPDSDADGISDGDEDTDRDGLSNLEEINLHGTEPGKWDTDEDGMPDGWEVGFLLDATAGAGANGANGPNGDPDGDDLSNFEEWLNGTAPDNPNSDGDAQNDGVEVAQGSNPKNAADNGEPPPAKDLVEVPFTVSDPSGSESEKWKMTITGKGPDDTRTMGLASVGFGEPATKTLKLRKWNSYEVTVEHLATDPNPPVNGETDYDWEATVDGLPTTVSRAKTEETAGVNNFFVAAKYWLVDNRQAVFTTEKHGDEENIVAGKKAILVPIEIGDNLVATGVDDVSVTAAPTDGGFQEHFWIMAPSGNDPNGNPCSNDMYFKIPVDPPAPLDFTCPNASPDPATVTIDFDSWMFPQKEPKATWRGTGAESSDNTPEFKVGEDDDDVDLPILVKSMKKRTVQITVKPLRKVGGMRPVPVPTEEEIRGYLNVIFGYQINTWFEVSIAQESVYDYDANNDGNVAIGVETNPSQSLYHLISSNPFASPNHHIQIFLIDNVNFVNFAGNLSNGIAINGMVIINRGANGVNPLEDTLQTFAHEISHIMVGDGHPDAVPTAQNPNPNRGPAPLESLDASGRLMFSVESPHAKLLVKAEWDIAEAWLKRKIDQSAQ